MLHVLTAKLKLLPTPVQHAALRTLQLAYRDGLNTVSCYAFAQGKLANAAKLQKAVYRTLRTQHHLPAQLACAACRQVGATYKGLWTRARQNAAHRHAGITKKRYKGLDQAPKYIAPTLIYTEGRDYGFKPAQQVSLRTLQGRIVVPYVGYDKHLALIRAGAYIGDAKLWYDAPRKERRFKLDVNHRIARQIVTAHPQSVIGLEHLTGIRERANRRHDPTASAKQRRANRRQATWSFADLQAKIAYKAALVGSVVIRIDADYTSQQCLYCGHTGRENRPNGGQTFVCAKCGARLHADLVGARNVALRTLAIRQDWVATGCLSTSPDARTDETKAARLQRYAELRWRSRASMPSALAGGR